MSEKAEPSRFGAAAGTATTSSIIIGALLTASSMGLIPTAGDLQANTTAITTQAAKLDELAGLLKLAMQDEQDEAARRKILKLIGTRLTLISQNRDSLDVMIEDVAVLLAACKAKQCKRRLRERSGDTEEP